MKMDLFQCTYCLCLSGVCCVQVDFTLFVLIEEDIWHYEYYCQHKLGQSHAHTPFSLGTRSVTVLCLSHMKDLGVWTVLLTTVALRQSRFPTKPVSACCWFSQARHFPFHSADCFQYQHACCTLKVIGTVERKGSAQFTRLVWGWDKVCPLCWFGYSQSHSQTIWYI